MGQYLSTPSTEKHSEDGAGGIMEYGASAMQGWRLSMEDAHISNPSVADGRGVFAVFDGHGGAEVALFCEKHLTEELLNLAEYKENRFDSALTRVFHRMDEMISSPTYEKELEKLKKERPYGEKRTQQNDPPEDPPEAQAEENDSSPKGADSDKAENSTGENDSEQDARGEEARNVRMQLEEGMQAYLQNLRDARSNAQANNNGQGTIILPYGRSEDDQKEAESNNEGGGQSNFPQNISFSYMLEEQQCNLPDHKITAGCTAVVALVVDREIIVANAGDSKAVLCRGGKAIGLSFEHKPFNEIEKRRIEAAGGFVSPAGRVNNNLNLSRSIGDLKYKGNKSIPPKDQMITSEPDICREKIQPEDEFMVIACDGVWDIMQNQECVDFIRQRIGAPGKKLSEICEEIFTACLAQDPKSTSGLGGDNMTAVIVRFKHE
uniref:PPM-type phosphatase domain-containing protein n=1 Tax=Rhodosorus marinus TaxID=101924 RepID=A0A7S3A355_9RHOD|mmetsp:Transcript_4175/g.17720  ORF Transcript_4175/g.17720 Transcript_4175/m.17720 type:complete len:435 (+) Transcript_4175:182-1486(+)|eukprot:CAMPEP_0113965722 /NCGR_PEP_ID=MMETSP0011_2-20120614/7914_1 /TAXON_ID=101924 /ORGANISM="Rhodosorus marinus" /LENGTH=434 /DNA_ID=CAMNT_0000978289 /DNA_START=133 /DNA_END=1437 /DNA_ORIENTATION=- /assembly_acc=CAM_ASM_000156